MDGSFYTRVGFGVIFIALFLVTLSQMATIRLKPSSQRNAAILGIIFFAMAIGQVSMVWGGLHSLPDWALVIVLVGAGFGMSAGLLMIKGAIDSKPKDV